MALRTRAGIFCLPAAGHRYRYCYFYYRCCNTYTYLYASTPLYLSPPSLPVTPFFAFISLCLHSATPARRRDDH